MPKAVASRLEDYANDGEQGRLQKRCAKTLCDGNSLDDSLLEVTTGTIDTKRPGCAAKSMCLNAYDVATVQETKHDVYHLDTSLTVVIPAIRVNPLHKLSTNDSGRL